MNKSIKLYCFLALVSMVLAGCSTFDLIQGKRVKPSDTIIKEMRTVTGFSGIDMGVLGKLVLKQSDVESVVVSGSDNIVKLVETNVRDGTLYIEAKEEFFVTSFTEENILTFTIDAKELNTVNISGIGELEMESLKTPSLIIVLSGGGNARINQLSTDNLKIVLSGMGTVELTGVAEKATIELSGTGSVDSPDLKINTADVILSGMGGATLWVTDHLTGEIRGTGGVSYFGNPQTNFQLSGLGEFKPLGNK